MTNEKTTKPEQGENPTKAELMEEENGLSEEINQAYIDIVGEEYATADQCEEAYQGYYDSDEEFAQELHIQIGEVGDNQCWPFNCIDWTQAAKELMYDYSDDNNYYFRNL